MCLFGDFPRFQNPLISGSDDGTNLQDEDGQSTAWLGGLPWPYRVTTASRPQRVRTSGGFEGMALSPDGSRLIMLLEKPLQDEAGMLRGFEFDIARRAYLPIEHRYPLDPGATAVGEFVLWSDDIGLTIERDDTEGKLDGLKRVYRVQLTPDGAPIRKRLLVDLLDIADPLRLAGEGRPGDIGLGPRFAMPYVTIEALLPLDAGRLAVLNDNNFPLSVGRHLSDKTPDDSELVVVSLPEDLPAKN